MKSLTAATLATIMSLGAAMELYEAPTSLIVDENVLTTDPSDASDASDGWDFAQVANVPHPDLYDIQEESEQF